MLSTTKMCILEHHKRNSSNKGKEIGEEIGSLAMLRITPDEFSGTLCGTRESWSAVCKARALPTILSL